MEEDASKDSKAVRVWLVKTNEELSEDMLTVLHLCEQYRSNGIHAEWITENDCLNKNQITKKDVFVLEKFSGNVFDKLSSAKATIVGPKCLSCCLNDGIEIPRHPTFTIAMKNLVITISGFSPKDKAKLEKYIKWMGGQYENQLTAETTHLISKTVFSEKYVKAAALSFPIMKAEWVEDVWRESQKKNISAKNPQFITKHELPIFYGICATTTGIKQKRERNTVIDLIIKNGGTYCADFESNKINILILNNDGIGTKKHACAVEYEIACVSPKWILKSVESGYALDYKQFLIEPANKNAPSTSSPNRTSQLPDMSINVSCIPNVKNNNFAEETCSTTSGDSTCVPYSSQKNQNVKNLQIFKASKDFAQLIDNIEIKIAKQAGSFLDGCSIYVYGASLSRRDKLQRIVSLAGGVRFDEPDESVTHTICCDPTIRLTPDQLSIMPNAKHVSVHWIIECIKMHKAVDEAHYIVLNCDNNAQTGSVKSKVTMPSPMSKINMQLLQTPTNRPPVPLFRLDSLDDNDDDVEIVQQYLSQPNNSEHANNEHHSTIKLQEDDHTDGENGTLKKTDVTNGNPLIEPNESDQEGYESEEESDFFKGLTFELRDIDEESEKLIASITRAGGTVVKSSRRKSKHYILVPINFEGGRINTNAEIITSSWLDDCWQMNSLVPIDYFHRPLKSIPESKPLSSLTISISMYVGSERTFLADIASFLGATVKSVLHRRISTHLICAEPKGAKYEGAISWGKIVVTNKWLLDCLAAEKHLPEGPYLVRASEEPEQDDSDEEKEEPESTQHSNRSEFSSSNKNMNSNQTEINEVAVPDVSDEKTSNKNMNSNRFEINEVAVPNDSDKRTSNKNMNSNRSEINEIAVPNVSDERTSNEITNFEPDDFVIEDNLLAQIDKQESNSTPLRKSIAIPSLGNGEMSPASRYIAMNRQGMITNSQDTPKRSEEVVNAIPQSNDTMSTPPMDNALSTPNIALFSTASKRRIIAVKRGEIPSEPPRTPRYPFIDVSTPESPFGKLLRPGPSNMSPESRKKLKKMCEEFPSPVSSKRAKQETPISELKNKFFKKFLESTPSRKHTLDTNDSSNDNTNNLPPKQSKFSEESNFSNNAELQDKLRLLDTMLTGGEGSNTMSTPRSSKKVRSPTEFGTLYNMESVNTTAKGSRVESQIHTVGWDDGMTEPIQVPSKNYRFMFAQNVKDSSEMKRIVQTLGGSVLEGPEHVFSATHFLYSTLSRSEKIFICIAGRKWVLHPDYLVDSRTAGRFVDEEFYEWGNPVMKVPFDSSKGFPHHLANAIYRFRTMPPSSPLPFHSFKVVLSMQETRKASIARILKAGGGEVLDIRPPYQGNIAATHCFMEKEKNPVSKEDLQFFADRDIPVCQPVYLSFYLTNDPPPPLENYLVPEYKTLINK